VAGGAARGTGFEDVPARSGAAGDDPETGRRRATARHSDDPGSGSSNPAKLPIFETDFEDSAYGYRPPRKEVHRLICRGYSDVVDADLSRYFDSIPHDAILKSVARRIVDRHVLRLIKLWLKAPIEGMG
jgi:hypothetical protein